MNLSGVKQTIKVHLRPPGSVRRRIVLASMTFSTVLALLTALFSYSYFTRSLRRTLETSTESNLQVVGAELDLSFERSMSFANWTQIDSSIAGYLDHMNRTDASSYSRSDRLLSFTVWKLLNQEYIAAGRNNEIQRIVIFTKDGSHYLQCLQGGSQPSYINVRRSIQGADWFNTLSEYPGYLWRLEQNPFSGSGSLFFPVVRPIERTTSADVAGYVFLEISPEIAMDSLSDIQLADDAALYLTLNGSGTPVTYEYRNRIFTPASLPDGLVSCTLPRTGFTLSMKPSDALFRTQSRHYRIITIVIFASVFLSGAALSQILRRMITRPVNALLAKTARIGTGDFSRDPSIEWDNEFGDIGRGINELSENVSTLMEKRLQDEKQKQSLEYQILQSQINPHFLYNTLNTIKWMATIQGSQGIAEMSTALSRLLKNVSKGTQTLIPLRDELDLVRDYFTIMKYRYGGTIELEIAVDREDLYDLPVNRFSLQPIVENAIFHGIEPKGSAGTIRIHAFLKERKRENRPQAEELLQIDVTDNGIGMDEEICRKALSPDSSAKTGFFRHVGISNVNQRIRYTFGPDYGLTIASTPGSSTTVTMTLPAAGTSESTFRTSR